MGHPRRADQDHNPHQLLVKGPPLSPAFAVERTGYDARGRAIEHTEALYRGDRYTYNVTLDRAYGQTSR